ncbi:GT2 family glycosyltransferase [Vibrio diazotrophicus]|uniref:GT2 family glycosyltransferase n=1 Tax=Vibrio diazotrophicus TaxID=685 RepID=A0A329DY76_VIBDI|nr:glycosyltransferase [Vibrio diazotrophicus]RAS55678.1 GT2 family glycosyltransferase [Vibrio diazotrophicus]
MQDNKYSREKLGDQQDSLQLVSSFVPENSKVLDVGCYDGALGYHLITEKKCIVDGIELDPKAAKEASKHYNKVVVANLNIDDVTTDLDGGYDYIIFADVLEHLLEPQLLLSKLKELLSENGKVIISVPNIGYQGVLASLSEGDFPYSETGILDRTHLRFFTRKTLKELIVQSGLYPNDIKNVILPVVDSEFNHYISKDKIEEQNNYLNTFPDTEVYQFVALCEKTKSVEKSIGSSKNKLYQRFKSKLYWSIDDSEGYNEANSLTIYNNYDSESLSIVYEIDKEIKFTQLRFDPCEESSFFYLYRITIKSEQDEILFIQDLNEIKCAQDYMKKYVFDNGTLAITSKGSDPGLLLDINNTSGSLNDKNLKIVIDMSNIQSYKNIDALLSEAFSSYRQILDSNSWKITKPIRKLISLKNRVLKNSREVICKVRSLGYGHLIKKLLVTIKTYGIILTIKKVYTALRHPINTNNEERYEQYVENEQYLFSRETSNVEDFIYKSDFPLISILLPVYNSNKEFLESCIESVIAQSYTSWELCICDDASTESIVQEILNNYSLKDSRIKFVISEENGHISNATNQALKLANGSHVVLLDHDDLLHKDALLYIAKEILNDTKVDLIYTDEDHVSIEGKRKLPFFKPDWSPVLLYSQNYIGHIVCLSKTIISEINGFTVGLEGAQDYDLLLKASLHAKNIVHIPRVLYHWREHEQSTAMNAQSKPYAHEAGKKALNSHLTKKYPKQFSHIEDGDNLFTYKPRFKIDSSIMVSIIVPIRDKVELLKNLVESIKDKSTWLNYEIIIVDNGSIEESTAIYLDSFSKAPNHKVVRDNSDFNWSKVNNIGVTQAAGDVFVFLNNDTLVLSEDWLETLVSWALLPDMAVVGPQLRYEDGTIQHAGIVVGMGGWADHVFKAESAIHSVGPFVSPMLNRNVLAVTGACQVIEKSKFEELGGYDEAFIICGSDIELCLRAFKKGYSNAYIADAILYHLESKSRSSFVPDNDFSMSKEKYEPFRTQCLDPFYNKNLELMRSTPTVKL